LVQGLCMFPLTGGRSKLVLVGMVSEGKHLMVVAMYG